MPVVRFLTLADVLLMSSAVSQPAATFSGEYLHTNLVEMAAAYVYHLCQDHPFADGNKRTALAAALVFLDINGVQIEDPSGKLYSAVIGVASGKKTKRAIADLLRKLASAARRE